MFITTIRNGLDGRRSTPLDGGLFVIEGEHPGRPDPAFRG
jgi:hypothetical protein